MSGGLPIGACDAHCHVFGPAERFPFDPGRTYTPADAPGSELLALHRRLGLDRAVLVQPACHGYDCAAMLDTIERSGGACRGVALVPSDVSADDIEALHRRGIRGVRFNYLPHLGPPPTVANLQRVAGLLAPFGWHLCLHIRAADISLLHSFLETSPVPFVIDHLARIDAARGAAQPAMNNLLTALALPQAWLKISGADRASAAGPPYDDVLPILETVIAARPDRLLWGTDWPHPNISGPGPEESVLIGLLRCACGTEEMLARILVENPRVLYQFETHIEPR